jgi:hypothetical protein
MSSEAWSKFLAPRVISPPCPLRFAHAPTGDVSVVELPPEM